MVKLQEASEFDKLETLLNELCQKYGLKLYVSGWTRKTFDVFREGRKRGKADHVARIESLAVSNGEIRFFDDGVTEFVTELGEELERGFGLSEAMLIREKRPEY